MSVNEEDLVKLIEKAVASALKQEKSQSLATPVASRGHGTPEEMASCPNCKSRALTVLEPEIRAKLEPEIKAKSLKDIVDIAKGGSHCKKCGLKVDPKTQDFCPLCKGQDAE